MTKLRQAVSLLALALLVGGLPARVDAAQVQTKVKPMNELLAGKLPLSISPAQRQAVIATKGGLSFNCNGTLCVCSGDSIATTCSRITFAEFMRSASTTSATAPATSL